MWIKLHQYAGMTYMCVHTNVIYILELFQYHSKTFWNTILIHWLCFPIPKSIPHHTLLPPWPNIHLSHVKGVFGHCAMATAVVKNPHVTPAHGTCTCYIHVHVHCVHAYHIVSQNTVHLHVHVHVKMYIMYTTYSLSPVGAVGDVVW